MKKVSYIILFLIINFGALYLGTLLMDNGPSKAWYLNLNKAPWTPPGWVFGAAWTTIMICFSVYMAYLVSENNNLKVVSLFAIQFLLNVSWNYVFFNQHLASLGFVTILLLTLLIFYFLLSYRSQLKLKTLFIAPYAIWLCIATSLNLYVILYN